MCGKKSTNPVARTRTEMAVRNLRISLSEPGMISENLKPYGRATQFPGYEEAVSRPSTFSGKHLRRLHFADDGQVQKDTLRRSAGVAPDESHLSLRRQL